MANVVYASLPGRRYRQKSRRITEIRFTYPSLLNYYIPYWTVSADPAITHAPDPDIENTVWYNVMQNPNMEVYL